MIKYFDTSKKKQMQNKLMLLFSFIGVLLIGFGNCCFSQELTVKDLETLKQQVQTEAQNLRKELDRKEYLSDFEKQITIDFTVDTFLIEQLLARRISKDWSTAGMIQATYDAELEYDKLLNKLYQQFMKKLVDRDKEILRQAQKSWILFRDNERKLNSEISKDEYSGGGTLQRVIVAGEFMEITRKRVLDLYGYLTRFAQ